MSDKTRADYEQEVRDSTSGRFEGEPSWTPYYYAWFMEGEGENVYDECEHKGTGEECYCEPDLAYIKFEITQEDADLFPELAGHKYVRLYISEMGFISTSLGS